jgi:tripartite-type tricarboxylate transporter receptor subunit TctC
MRLSRLLPMVLVAVAFAAAASAQSYPTRPVKLLVGYPAGGGQDLIARLIANKLTESLGQPVVVENKPGASGLIAADTVAKSAPDGYTLLLGSSGPLTLNPLIFPKVPYDPVRDFVPISTFGFFPLMLAVHPDVPARTPQEFIAYAKANPGKLNNGSSAVSMQLAAEMLNQSAGLSITTVRYAGSAAAVNALISGEVQLTILESTPLLPQIDAGKVRAIAVMSDRRIGALPNLPTMSESGVPGFEITFWTGLVAPAGTSPAIVSKLSGLLVGYIEMPDVRERLKAIGAEPGVETSAQLAARINSDIAKFGPVVKATNLKAE